MKIVRFEVRFHYFDWMRSVGPCNEWALFPWQWMSFCALLFATLHSFWDLALLVILDYLNFDNRHNSFDIPGSFCFVQIIETSWVPFGSNRIFFDFAPFSVEVKNRIASWKYIDSIRHDYPKFWYLNISNWTPNIWIHLMEVKIQWATPL